MESRFSRPVRLMVIAAALLVALVATTLVWRTSGATPAVPGVAVPVPEVAVLTTVRQEVRTWDEFSGRLEAVEQVAVRSRVSGAVQAIHFAEGQLVRQGDLLLSIDPGVYAAAVAQAEAQVTAARARLLYTQDEVERARRLWPSRAIARTLVDQRERDWHEAQAALQAAQASLQLARLNLGYCQIYAPVSGRIGRREVTVGNLVDAGPNSPVLTSLVSVDPIYVSFDADEQALVRALGDLSQRSDPSIVPVRMRVAGAADVQGQLQLVDNQVDARSGTVRVRAVFANADGRLMPGQFARLHVGQARPVEAVLVDERAIGTDQDRRYVMVVDADDTAQYREVTLGGRVEGQRIIAAGLRAGERVVVSGLQRVRSGTRVAPQPVDVQARGVAPEARR